LQTQPINGRVFAATTDFAKLIVRKGKILQRWCALFPVTALQQAPSLP
jgi:hypothetical protein